ADTPSLDLFCHLVFAIGDAALDDSVPFALVGTHRPAELHSPLARALLRLQQEERCQSLDLLGLNHSEVDALIRSLGVTRPSHTLGTTINEARRGNPLFIQEVLHHMARHGGLYDRGGYMATLTSPTDLPLPERLTAALEARTHTLSAECLKVLSLAAFLGE